MGEADARLGEFAEAEETLKRALRPKPDYARAQFSLGCTFADFANRGAAWEEYERLNGMNSNLESCLIGFGDRAARGPVAGTASSRTR